MRIFYLHCSPALAWMKLNLVLWEKERKRKFFYACSSRLSNDTIRDYYGDAASNHLQGDQPIGRIFVHRNDEEIGLVEISLLPEYRGFGIGGSIIATCWPSRRYRQPSRLHVQCNNPAVRLYHRLGFRLVSDSGVYFLMEWLSPPIRPHQGL